MQDWVSFSLFELLVVGVLERSEHGELNLSASAEVNFLFQMDAHVQHVTTAGHVTTYPAVQIFLLMIRLLKFYQI